MNRSTLSSFFTAAAMVVLLGAAVGFTQSIDDHALISRFPGSTVSSWVTAPVKEFDEIDLPTGPYLKGKFAKTEHLEGKITRLIYDNPKNHSTLEIYRSYQEALSKAGFQALFACSYTDCGNAVNDPVPDFGYWCVTNKIQCPEPMRYIVAKLPRPIGDAYVAVKVRTEETYLNVVEVKPMAADQVSTGNPTAAAATATPTLQARPLAAVPLAPALAAPVRRTALEIPAGTMLTVRMIDAVDSRKDSLGKTYQASLDKPVNDAHGNTLLPRGTNVVVKLVEDRQSGKFAGKTMLTLEIVTLSANGHDVDADTMGVTEESGSRGKRTGGLLGGGAAAGGILGGLFGGGTGAAIGAASGAGAGALTELVTRGQRVRVPSEARLAFRLQQTIRV
jgi:hypothetical protein